MDPPSSICFLPIIAGVLLVAIVKGIILCPVISFIIVIGNSAIILGLWPTHVFWTYYCILRSEQVGWCLKFVVCLFVLPVVLVSWPVLGLLGSVIGGAALGFVSPVSATFDAVKEAKSSKAFHCVFNGTWSSIKESFVVISDFRDVCLHSYLSAMEDLQQKEPPDGRYYEIRLLHLPGALLAGIVGVAADVAIISAIAVCKSPCMLLKGWRRLLQDLMRREGPFSETICVPFGGLAILLWPLAVVGALACSVFSSILFGAYASVVAYQESSFWSGLCYILASISIYDEYTNDILDTPNFSCFPRPIYRNKDLQPPPKSQPSISQPSFFKSFADSFNNPMLELKPSEVFDCFFDECKRQGEIMVSKGLITFQDIEDHPKSSNGGGVVTIGLPAYCILQTVFRSVKAGSVGFLLSDNITEITGKNRPRSTFFDWFFIPLLIIKEQIKAANLSEEEEGYLSRLVLLSDDPIRLMSLNIAVPPESECKSAVLQALARRLRGITRSISRYPTCRRRFSGLVESVSECLAGKNGGIIPSRGKVSRSRSAIGRFWSQLSFKSRTGNDENDGEFKQVERDVEIA